MIAEQQQIERPKRKNVRHGGTLCSKCLVNPPRPKARYCKPCKNAYDNDLRAKKKAASVAIVERRLGVPNE